MEEKDNSTAKKLDEIYCPSCGKAIKKESFVCPHCGVKNKLEANKKSKIVAVLLAIFLGGIGVHKFYLKKNGAGIVRIVIFVICFATGMIYHFISVTSFITNITTALTNTATATFDASTITEFYNPMAFFNPLFLLLYILSILGVIDGIILLCMDNDKFDEKYNK